ncbi:hypothetical protein HDU84_002454 [Entophlyctis sp. JEL0112]|nr:hypothetical protein HDU84_002454 [Entophlyctis sp. JEL0112]
MTIILHSALKFVRSPIMTNLLQIGSRLTMVWAVAHLFPEVTTSWAYTAMAFAWSLTEIVRYGFYTFNLLGVENEVFKFLTFCRYNFFFVLYPLGALSEFILLKAAYDIASTGGVNVVLTNYLLVCLVVWPPGFYVMYTHMIGQRRKVMKAAKQAKGAAAAAAKKD